MKIITHALAGCARLLLSASLLSLVALALTACDKMYEAHLSVSVPPSAGQSAESVAGNLVSHLSSRFALRCERPEVWAPPAPSTETSEVHRECSARADYTQITIVTAGNQLTVDVEKIGGVQEPETFRAVRLAAQEYLQRSVPGAGVSVEYPSGQ